MDVSSELRDLSVQINAIIRTISLRNGLTLPQANILLSIPTTGVSLIDLSNKLGLDISTMSRNIKKLSTMNLVIRERSSHDLREYLILFTDNGDQLASRINNEFDNILSNIPELLINNKMFDSIEKINWLLIKSRNNL
tara:strand:- start:448 stop:861 length:414 start_codon:yes stop_codon:yes gene_type:complete